MPKEIQNRIKELFKKVKVNVILIANVSFIDPNFFYLSQLEKSEFNYAFLVIRKPAKRKLITHQMEYNLAKNQTKFPVIAFKTSGALKILLKKEFLRDKKIGLNFSGISASDLKGLRRVLKKKKFIDISKQLNEIRRIKTKEEIKRIAKACGIASKVMKETLKIMKAGMKEKEVAAEIEKRMKYYRADEIAFPTIVASGKNSANPHYSAGDKRIRKGELIIVDFGCKYRNYNSDITRTFILGKPNKKQKEMFETCLKMQNEVLKSIKSGITVKKLQERANSICEKKYGKMIHSVLHGIGIETHDPIGKKLEEGMALAIEPAIYIPGFGGARIEDDILVTKRGYKKLTR